MARRDQFFSLSFVILAGYACWQSVDLGIGTFAKPGPGFFPFLSSLALGGFAIVTLFKDRFLKKQLEELSDRGIGWTPLVLTFASLLGFILSLKFLGFIITTFFFIGFLLRAVEKKTWIVSAMVALSVSLGTYLLFDLLLQSQLPQGPFGF